MPEGHSIHRAARRLAAGLAGKRLASVAVRGRDLVAAGARERLEGSTVTGVEARGKHLLLHVDAGWSLHSHLRMDGSWHLYRSGERWTRSPRAAWIALDAGDWVGVNFDGPVLELHRTDQLLRDRRLLRLGPDVLTDEFDEDEYLRRMRAEPRRELGDALMQQRIVAGIGNIFKAESCFLAGLDPWARVADLSDDELRRVREVATRIMREGVLDPRVLTFSGPGRPGRWAYGRGGQPCRRCAAPIAEAAQGADQRTTWWCPSCQSSGGG